MKIKQITQKVANQLNLNEKFVYNTYLNYWRIIRNTLQELPIKEERVLSKEEFDLLTTSVNLTRIGKLYCDYDWYLHILKHIKKEDGGYKYKVD